MIDRQKMIESVDLLFTLFTYTILEVKDIPRRVDTEGIGDNRAVVGLV